MPRAIDFHVHLPITEFMEVAIGPFRAAAERYFRSEVKLRDIEEIAAYYHEQDIVGVLLAWDAETATGRKPLRNETVAEIVRRFPAQFVGFASVDPLKGDRAIAEIERAVKELGLSGAKFHPGVQAFYPTSRASRHSSPRSPSWASPRFSTPAPMAWARACAAGAASSWTTRARSIWIAWPPTTPT